MSSLKFLKISKLHGYKNYNIDFKDNTLILIGENGAGKTTILRILYYLLSGQWNALRKFDFDQITLGTDIKSYKITSADLKKHTPLSSAKLKRFSPSLRKRYQELLNEYSNRGTSSDLHRLSEKYRIPLSFLLEDFELNLFEEDSLFIEPQNRMEKDRQDMVKNFGKTQILYLPTYRRIEHELSTIFKGIDEAKIRSEHRYFKKQEMPRHAELVEFGMKDVESSIEDTLENLKEFARESLNSLTLGYLGDVVEKKYLEVDVKQINAASNETIKNILDRIDNTILSNNSKRHLSETIEDVKKGENLNEHSKVICHYFIKLLNFQQELERKELCIRGFCEVCNKYMEDKFFEYISSSFSFKILPHNKINSPDTIKLDQLSSGEKQIVSLFSHLYLTNQNDYFVLIDEPELSLSVTWQRQFLADINQGDFCSGLVAVTHSPFIYDNELEKYSHGLGEFLTIKG